MFCSILVLTQTTSLVTEKVRYLFDLHQKRVRLFEDHAQVLDPHQTLRCYLIPEASSEVVKKRW